MKRAGSARRGKRLGAEFFRREAEVVARELIGCVLVRNVSGREMVARIVETEAYVGPHDLACHASKGLTARTQVLYGPAGRAYVYFIYGMHEMLNVVTGDGSCAGQAVLIRAAEAISGFGEGVSLSGPARLTRAMEIDRSLNGAEVTGESLYFQGRVGRVPRLGVSARIGVEYAKEWSGKMLRFFDAESAVVSKVPRRSLGLKRRRS
jgi:DNA-3-methyladenine glycosylase